MKIIIITKDQYLDNSVRVNIFEKDAIRKYKIRKYNKETKKEENVIETTTFDNLLYCTRLSWNINENELDEQIEQLKQVWEKRINS